MLVKKSYIKVFGQKIVFQQLLNDLIKLETEGIELQGRRVKCQLFSFLGDNLGSHMIGGFSESFSCEFFCRYCLMTKDKFKTEPYESGVLRNVSHYETVVKRLQLQNANMMHGIKINSVFNQLQSFHVCRPGLPPCIGHDLFEGVVAYDLPLFVKHFVDQHWFTYDILNARIRRFLYMGCDAASKPPAFSVNGKRLAGQAVENWCLLRLFPIIVHDLISVPTDRVWLLLLQLKLVVELSCAPALSHAQVGYLNVAIKEYVCDRISLFPNHNLRPKHHFMIHYAYLFLQFGPLIRLWTMRLESKHSYFKKAMRNIRNFKNVTKTLAHLHQLYYCYMHTGTFLKDPLIYDDIPRSNITVCDSRIQQLLMSSGLLETNPVITSKVEYHGTAYQEGMIVVFRDEDSEHHRFGLILHLVISCSKEFCLVVKRLNSSLVCNMGVYCLTEEKNCLIKVIKCFDLVDYMPLHSYTVDGNKLLSLKHALLSVA